MLSARRLAERSISSRFTSLVGVDFDNCWDCFTGGCGWKGCNSDGLFGLGVGAEDEARREVRSCSSFLDVIF